MIQYILLSSTIVFLSIFAYIKIKYPFWNNQPVYHTYDIWRTYYRCPFIIHTAKPVKTKFCDFSNIKTVEYLEISDFEKSSLIDLLQCYYIPTEEIIHNIKKEDIDAYLTGQLHSSYVSLYIDLEYQILRNGLEPEDIKPIPKPVGCITSRSLVFLYIDPDKPNIYEELPIYYIEFLAVNREKEAACISRKLLQTHEYHQRLHNIKINVSIIKKEIELFNGVIPLIQYPTYLFSLRNIHFPPIPMHHEVLQITTENIDVLLDFLHIQKNIDTFFNPFAFDILIFPDIGNIIALIKQRLLFVFCLRQGENIYAMYFIKDAKTQYEKLNYEDIENNTLQACASISNCESNELFFLGYLHALRQIIEKNKKFRMILMEIIGHNCFLYKYWREKHTPIFKNDTAYYLFNMIYPSSPNRPEKTFILL
jgi:hypothetical protein